MAIIQNEADKLLQATSPRLMILPSNYVTIDALAYTFTTSALGTNPNSITLRANLNGELRGTVAWSTVPVVAFTQTGNSITISSSVVAAGTSVEVTASILYFGNTYTSTTNISHIAENVTSSLSTSSVQINTAADGTGGNYSAATSTMTVNVGSVNNSGSWAFSWSVPAGVTATGASTATISVSAMTIDTAQLTCTATRTGFPTQIRTFTVTKSKNGTNGVNGVSAPNLTLTKDSHVLPATIDGIITSYLGASTSARVFLGLTDDTANWSFSYTQNDVSIGSSASGGTGGSAYTVVVTSIPSSVEIASITITATKLGTTLTKTFSVSKAKQGAEGDPANIDVSAYLRKDSESILSGAGTIGFSTSGGIRSGTIAWNSSGVLTSGNGVAITQNGLVGAKNGVATFTVNASTGTASFAGDINTAGDGTFTGISTTTYTVSLSGAGINSVQVDPSVMGSGVSNPSNSTFFRAGVFGYAAAGSTARNIGVVGNGLGGEGTGILGIGSKVGGLFNATGSTAGNYGVWAFATAGGSAVAIRSEGTISSLGSISSQADIIGYSSSDIRLKTNIRTIPDALYIVSTLNGVRFTWKSEFLKQNLHAYRQRLIKKHDIGLIAQEVQQLLPELVSVRKSGILAVNYEKLVPILIEAIKELHSKVEVLEERIGNANTR